MLNSFIIVGRILKKGEVKVVKNALGDKKHFMNIEVSVSRNFKNEDGVYDTDILVIRLVGNVAINANEYCNVGDCVGCKGRIERVCDTERDDNRSDMILHCEKLTFLSSSHNTDSEKSDSVCEESD